MITIIDNSEFMSVNQKGGKRNGSKESRRHRRRRQWQREQVAAPHREAKVKAGDQYKCSVCGLVVSVDETCGCVETCDIICCDTQMKKKR